MKLSITKNFNHKKVLIGSISMILFSIFICFIGLPKIIKFGLKKQLVLSPESELRGLWAKPPFAVTFKIYLFNVTNPDEVVEGGKPKVNEIGPYIFDEYKDKINLVDNEEEDSVSFDMKNTFIFRPDLTEKASGLKGNERITIPHLLIMGGLIAIQRDKGPLLTTAIKALTSIFKPTSPFLTASVMDILFNGIPIDCSIDDFSAQSLCSALENEKAIKIINETHLAFSILDGTNGTSLGRFEVNRGVRNIHKLGDVIKFNDDDEVDNWDGECNKIKGTDSTIFAPFHKKEDILFAFAPDLCRSLGASYLHPSSYDSIPTGFYSIHLGDLKNEPSQHCFCRDQDLNKCPPKGTLDLYPCVAAPLIISKPQFLDADEKLLHDVDGLNPNREKHDIFLHLEMITSTPISAAKRLQFSMEVEPVPQFPLMAKMPQVLIPLMWVEESAHLNKTFTKPFSILYTVLKINSILKWSGIVFGILGLAVTAFKMMSTGQQQKNENVLKHISAVHPTIPSVSEKVFSSDLRTET